MATLSVAARGFACGLRLKLLLAAGILLLIPLLGFLYVRELEHLLLKVQEQGVIATARAVGTALNDRPSLFLSGEVYPFALAQGKRPEDRQPSRADRSRRPDRRLDAAGSDAALCRSGCRRSRTSAHFPRATGSAGTATPSTRCSRSRMPKVVLRDPDRDALQAADHAGIGRGDAGRRIPALRHRRARHGQGNGHSADGRRRADSRHAHPGRVSPGAGRISGRIAPAPLAGRTAARIHRC